MTNDDDRGSNPSRGYADARLVERAFKELTESANEMSRAHALNHLGLLHALLLKGVISQEELEAGRERAKPVVDQHFGPTPKEKKAELLRELFDTIKGRA